MTLVRRDESTVLSRSDPKRCWQIVGIGNAFEASIAAKNGADALWISSLCVAINHMLPDENLVSTDQLISLILSIRRILPTPIIVDGGTGGSLSQTVLLSQSMQAAGASAICIEDARLPKKNSLGESHRGLVSIDEFTNKLQLLATSRSSEDFLIIARNESLVAGCDIHHAMQRACAYVDVGANAIFLHSRRKEDAIEFGTMWKRDEPLIICPTAYPDITLDEAREAGVSGVVYANQGTRTTLKVLDEVYSKLLRSGSIASIQESLAPLGQLLEYTEEFPNRVDGAYLSSTDL